MRTDIAWGMVIGLAVVILSLIMRACHHALQG